METLVNQQSAVSLVGYQLVESISPGFSLTLRHLDKWLLNHLNYRDLIAVSFLYLFKNILTNGNVHTRDKEKYITFESTTLVVMIQVNNISFVIP